VGIILVNDEDDLMLVTDTGKLIRMPVSGISVISRNTQGVRLIVIDADERVVSAARLAEQEDPTIDGGDAPDEPESSPTAPEE
jgi:DNA gyrase subunit A